MKNKVFSMVIVLLVVGFLLAACDMGNDNNTDDNGKGNNGDDTTLTKFEGKWMNPYGSHPAFTFTGNTYKHFNAFDFLNEGTFTFTGTTITFIPTEDESWTQTYTLSGNTISLDADGYHNYGPFVKNYEPEKTKFEGVWKNNYDGTIILTFRYNCFSVFQGSNAFSDYGLFTFDDSSITFTDWNNNLKWKNNGYELNDTTLKLPQPEGGGWYGTYTKQNENKTMTYDDFEGTWMNPYGNHPVFIFTENTYKHFNVFDFISEGTFTFTDKIITFFPTEDESWTQEYTFKINVLTLKEANWRNSGPFVKDYEPEKTKFEGVWTKDDDDTFKLTFRYNCFSVFWEESESYDYDFYGTFTFDDSSITFQDWINNDLEWENEYTLNDTTLTLSQPPDDDGFSGTFTKQPD